MMRNKKFLLGAVLVVLLLIFAVGGTLAYLVTQTDPVVNTFTPADVSTEIKETFVNNVKSSITVKNKGDIPVYVRVALVGNWCDSDGNVVEPWNGSVDINNSDWIEGSYGYYYYKTPLAASATTSDLLGTNITESVRADGAHLEITVLQQSIQAEPTTAVQNAWGVTVAANGTITTTGN